VRSDDDITAHEAAWRNALGLAVPVVLGLALLAWVLWK
jgi:hypothetical protein